MKMNYTIVGDPHAKKDNLDIMSILCEQVESMGKDVVWLGDMLHNKEIISGQCLNFWLKYFYNSKLNHYVLVGNHDWFNLQCQDHSLKALSELDNVFIVEDKLRLDNMWLIPYLHDQKALKKVIKEGKALGADILIGHLEVKSFDFGNGHICDDGITLQSFKDWGLVISGHFHKYQKKKNLVYLGAPFSHSFGEANQDKFIATLDTETKQLELIDTKLPKHIDVEIEWNETSSIEQVNKSFENTKDYCRLILTGKQEHLDTFPAADLAEGVKLIKRPTTEAVNNVNVDETFSNAQQFSQWGKSIKKLDDETIKLGLEILGAVSDN